MSSDGGDEAKENRNRDGQQPVLPDYLELFVGLINRLQRVNNTNLETLVVRACQSLPVTTLQQLETVRQIFCAVTPEEKKKNNLRYTYFAEDNIGINSQEIQEQNQGVFFFKILVSEIQIFQRIEDILFLCMLLANTGGRRKTDRQNTLKTCLVHFDSMVSQLQDPAQKKLLEQKIMTVLSCPLSKAEIYTDLCTWPVLPPSDVSLPPSVTKWKKKLQEGSVLYPAKETYDAPGEFTDVPKLFRAWYKTFHRVNTSFPSPETTEQVTEEGASAHVDERRSNFSSSLYQKYYATVQNCYETDNSASFVPTELDADANALILQLRW
jgi:hypothetical protein